MLTMNLLVLSGISVVVLTIAGISLLIAVLLGILN